MNVSVATTIMSNTVAALFRRFFSNDPNKMALAYLVDLTANALKIMQSRSIEHDKDWLKCAYGFYLTEQQDILSKFVNLIVNIKWYSLEGPGISSGTASKILVHRGPKHKTNYLHFPYGIKLAVSCIRELYVDMKVCQLKY